jgi:4-hydroxy-tetrahydrodipicolinate synthase
MITPLKGIDQLDEAGVEQLIEHMIAGGVHGLFVLGTSGEGPSLSYRLRQNLITQSARIIRRRIPLLVGITDTSVVEMMRVADKAAEAGAAALVLSAPYYFPPGQAELLRYVERLAPRLPLPYFLYNMPQMTKVEFGPPIVEQLAEDRRLLGIKDSSGSLNYLDKVIAIKQRRPDWAVFAGPEHLLLETLKRGGDGGVNGGAVFWPALFTGLFEAFSRGDMAAVDKAQRQLLKLNAVYSVGADASAVIKAMKYACAQKQLCTDIMAEPFEPFTAAEQVRARDILVEAGFLG